MMSPARSYFRKARYGSLEGSVARVIAALSLAGAVGGCAVGPDYDPPAAHLSEFHSAAAVAGRTGSAPRPSLDAWWEGFRDPELTRIIGEVLRQNLDLQAALARVEQARWAASGSGARLLPSIDLDSTAVRQRQSQESPIGAIGRNLPGYQRYQSLYDAGVSASWEIDLFGGLRRAADAASEEAEAAEAAHLGTRISVAADAADAYLRIRGDQVRISVAKEQVATNAQLLSLVQERFGQGLATDREVAQAEALLASARASLQPLTIALEIQLNRLDVLMGVQPGTYARELDAKADIPAAPAIGRTAAADLLRRRPDIIAAERRLAASNSRIGVAIADYYPKFSLAGVLGFESSNTSDLFRAATFQPQGILGLRWRLFDFGKIDAEVGAAKGAEKEALADYRQSVLHAAEDVENAFTALVQFEAHVQELKRDASSLTRARDLSRQAYQAGVIPLTDVLDANRQLLSAEDALAEARVDAASAAVSAFRALGGGWSADNSKIMEVAND